MKFDFTKIGVVDEFELANIIEKQRLMQSGGLEESFKSHPRVYLPMIMTFFVDLVELNPDKRELVEQLVEGFGKDMLLTLNRNTNNEVREATRQRSH